MTDVPESDTTERLSKRALDSQPTPNEDRLDLEELAGFLPELFIATGYAEKDDEGWSEFFEGVLLDFPVISDEEEPAVEADALLAEGTVLTARSGRRTYRLEVIVDPDFGNNKDKVIGIAQRMLDQAVQDQTKCFYERAKRRGLTWRRRRTLPFRHPLPYRNPPPTTADGKYQEEAAVVAAAFHFACTRDPPTKFHIQHFANNNNVLGSATVNLYTRRGLLRISLNGSKIDNFNEATWASVAAHEVLHNLGWGHPRGSYPPSLAIEIYQHCIKGGGQGRADEEEAEELNFVR